MKRCRRCLLPGAAPGAAIDRRGVCAYCREFAPALLEAAEIQRRGFADDLAVTLASTRGTGQYDVLVPFSGGKDSIVIKDLVQRAGVKYDAHFNNTTIEDPKTIRYIKKYLHNNV